MIGQPGAGTDRSDQNAEATGRSADSPNEIPAIGWFDILKRVWRRLSADNLSLVAAGVAFYGLLALFPGIAALISLFGMVADQAQVETQFSALGAVLPVDAYQLIEEQMLDLASGSENTLGVGLVSAFLLSVWSATRGTKSLMTALNIVYDEDEERSFLR
ncbi:MAG: YhjD/YihY/BrkB family envelope integrity protein, partial [Thiohalocapsa sp.]